MKTKLLTLAGAIILASTSWAELLYWQVGDTTGINPDWTYAAIYQTTGNTVGGDTGTALANITGDSSNPTKIDRNTASSPVAAILSSGYPTANFYIELYGGQSGDQLVGWSQQVVSYDALQQFTSSQLQVSVNDPGFSGKKFTAVPEPTSGLMLLLGAAMLGLRRKRIA